MAESKDKVVRDYVVEQFQRYENYHKDRFDKAEAIYDRWIGKPPVRKYSWQNAVRVPMTFESEQTITPRLFVALFPNDAPLDIQVEGNAPKEEGIRIKHLIQHYFRVSQVHSAFHFALRQATLFGTGYTESGSWFVKRGWIINELGERVYTILESRPNCKPVNFFEMYPHPAKVSVDDGLPIIRRRFCDGEYLKTLGENPHFDFDKLDEALKSESPVSVPTMLVGADGKALNLKDKRYEILEYWGPYDQQVAKDGKTITQKSVPHWIILINRSVVVRMIPNPYNHQIPPYVRLKLYEDARQSWFGVGTGEIGYPTQERLDKIVNQRLDNVDLVISKQGAYNGNDPLINVKKLQENMPGR
ncbi:hypothetical protein LCGC14_2935210, partial [marine sediment metagenome]